LLLPKGSPSAGIVHEAAVVALVIGVAGIICNGATIL
jgi:hypothetical protein